MAGFTFLHYTLDGLRELLKYSNPHSCPVSILCWPNVSFPLRKDHNQGFTLTTCFTSYKLSRPRGTMTM